MLWNIKGVVRDWFIIIDKTRKSSCVNARGIPPAAQQMFTVLIWPGRDGGRCYLPWLGGEYLLWPGGTCQGRYLPSGPGQDRYPPPPSGPGQGRYPPARVGIPHLDLARVGTPSQGRYPPGCGQTNKLKLLPFPILRVRAVNMRCNK